MLLFFKDKHFNAGADYGTKGEGRTLPSKTRKSRQTRKSSTGGFSCTTPASSSLYKFSTRSYASSNVCAYPM